jgi:transposase
MFYPGSALERAMRIQEVVMRAISGEIQWFQAAEILGVSCRTIRRWKAHFERAGYDTFIDRRRQHPSPKRVAVAVVQEVVRLYRERYADLHVKHFQEKLVEEHGIKQSYTWVKTVLQKAGLVTRRPRRGKHRRRRPRRPLPGMLLHLDASRHTWMPMCPDQQDDLLVLMDDASNRVYEALLVPEENTWSVMRVLYDCIQRHGVFCSLYTDRASHFTWTPGPKEPRDPRHRTQVGRALEQLGVEHILAHSPQARGRSERLFGTWQKRLPQELRLREVRDRDTANKFLKRTFVPWHNRTLAVTPAETGSAFVPLTDKSVLDRIFALEHTRIVANDNTVSYGKRALQIPASPHRFSFARSSVTVREHLDGHLSLWHGPRPIGWYDAVGQLLPKAPKLGRGTGAAA